MSFKNFYREAEEQKTSEVLVRDEWQKYYGELDTEEKMNSAGRMLVQLIENEGKKIGRAFYTWLHEKTKNYLHENEDYLGYEKIVRYCQPVSAILRQREQNEKDREKFLELLKKRQYRKAREFAICRLGRKINNAYEKSTYCRVGYSHLDSLLIAGKSLEARRCAKSLEMLNFNTILDIIRGERKKNRVDKPYKVRRRN